MEASQSTFPPRLTDGGIAIYVSPEAHGWRHRNLRFARDSRMEASLVEKLRLVFSRKVATRKNYYGNHLILRELVD